MFKRLSIKMGMESQQQEMPIDSSDSNNEQEGEDEYTLEFDEEDEGR